MSDSIELHGGARPLLIQFAKWPEAGRVKTRLIPALGPLGALEAHVALIRTVFANLLGTGHPVEFWWDREMDSALPEATGIAAELEDKGTTQRVQSPGDLGYRMLSALNDGLTRATRVIIVGSDCPSVDPDYLKQAVAALEHADIVLGPAEDGGFVLIGARRTDPEMLNGITWGSGEALAQSLDQLRRMGLSVRLLSSRWDVDELEGWERFLMG
jgi:rSAM/selenodomain-associated transferase 1